MFKKLDVDFVLENFEYSKKIIEYGRLNQDGQVKPKIVYHHAVGQCKKLLDILIPEEYRKDFDVAIMDIAASVGPHTDSKILVSINHYFQTNDEKTTFYSFKEGAISKFQIDNQTNGFVFNPEQLVVYDYFVAKPNETWILDVTKPHSVYTTRVTDKQRRAIVVQTTKHSYEKVMEMITGEHNEYTK